MEKERLDILLVKKGLSPSREKARASIMAGVVYVDGVRIDKPGAGFDAAVNLDIEIRHNINPYVSRGGLKLEKAIYDFNIVLNGCVAMDIGASTGGFTDCMLKNGAAKIYAVDVGYGQLAWELRNDSRVVNMERTNIRYVTRTEIEEELDFASIDVSFISLKKVLPVLAYLIKQSGTVVSLIKPQFEAGRDKVGKHGVVRDKEVHISVVADIVNFSNNSGFVPIGLTFSPVKGPEGNIEYLLYLKKQRKQEVVSDNEGSIHQHTITEQYIRQIVEDSHNTL